jgi:uridylate kinase
MRIVISLGGSLLTRSLTPKNFKGYAEVLRKLKKDGHKLVVVCGGGSTCRKYQRIAKKLGADNVSLDRIGIAATHLNAMTLIACLGEDAYPLSLRTPQQVVKNLNEKILVCGGNLPGCSTDYDAALFAKAIKADLLINATNVKGVYSSDPKKNPRAKRFKKLSYEEFERIISGLEQTPGEYRLFDLKAAKLIKKARIKTLIIDGRDPKNILKAVEGKVVGTIISD